LFLNINELSINGLESLLELYKIKIHNGLGEVNLEITSGVKS